MSCSVGQLLTDHETRPQERTKTVQVATDSSIKKCYSYLNIILADLAKLSACFPRYSFLEIFRLGLYRVYIHSLRG